MKTQPMLAALGCTLAATGLAHSALYSSDADFAKGTNGASTNILVAGWGGFYGKAEDPAVNTTAANPNTNAHRVGLYDAANSGQGVDEYLYFQSSSGQAAMDYFAHTSSGSTFSAFSPADHAASLTATWLKRSGDTFGTYSAAVLVAGTWYASGTDIGADGAPVFDFFSGDWVEILNNTEASAAPLALGTTATDSATLFSGNTIDGFGFFVTDLGSTRTLRIDNIRINGVPEPSSALLGICGALLMLRRRR